MASDDDSFFADALSEFPPVHAAFAYGSAVFGQRGYSEAKKLAAMTDMVFVVDDACSWHRVNLERNSVHYAWPLASLGPNRVTALQAVGAGIYYNTRVRVCGRNVKYGVVERAALHDDLTQWRSLYIAGRMHKPIRHLTPVPAELQPHIASNLHSALAAALLLMPTRFADAELFGTICSLSYGGDVRMGIGDSHLKPDDIAVGQHKALADLYQEPLTSIFGSDGGFSSGGSGAEAGVRIQDDRLPARQQLLAALPAVAQAGVLHELGSRHGQPSPSMPPVQAQALRSSQMDEATTQLWREASSGEAANAQISGAVSRTLARIVRRASLVQTAKGVLTAGAATSVVYALAKIRNARFR